MMSGTKNPKSKLKRTLSSENVHGKHVKLPLKKSNNHSRRRCMHINDKFHSRRYQKTNDNEYIGSIFKYNQYTEEQFDKKRNRYERLTSGDSTVVSNSRNNRTSLEDHDLGNTQTYFEESMQDPSTCNFQTITYPTEKESVLNYADTKSLEGKKEEVCTRLERLEKLVEMLVNNCSTSTSIQTYIRQENNTLSEMNTLELIPRNTKFTTSMWLNKIDEECIERNFDERTSIEFIQSQMTGIIKAWFKTLSVNNFTWPELKMFITKIFPDNIDFVSTLKLLVERNFRPNESIHDYYYSKMYLLEACKISGENAVSCLLDGLPSEYLKEEGKRLNCLMPEALYSQFLSKLSQYEFDHIRLDNQEQGVSSYEDELSSEVYERTKIRIDHSLKHKIEKCYTCNKFGHNDVACRHAPICYNCKRPGHIILNCPLNN